MKNTLCQEVRLVLNKFLRCFIWISHIIREYALMINMTQTHLLTSIIATLTQIIKDLLPKETRMTCQSSDLIIQLSMNFLHFISDMSNNVCNEEGKKTITPSHVAKALKVSFANYLIHFTKYRWFTHNKAHVYSQAQLKFYDL